MQPTSRRAPRLRALRWFGGGRWRRPSLLAALACLPPPVHGEAILAPRLAARWEALAPADPLVVWVEFADKGPEGDRPGAVPADLPLCTTYVAAVGARVARIRERSRWLNSLSVEASRLQLAAVRELSCVRSIDLVSRARRAPAHATNSAAPGDDDRLQGPGYGGSAGQLHLIGADALHDRGLYGLGVLVAHFDTGYERLSHEVFRTLRVAAAYDFVDHDTDPTDARSNPDDLLDHGHETLSVLAGFKPGKLVGVAPGATYLLARTESSALEEPVEEDHWIAALEWADSLGADIVSSSLKFLDYDPPWMGYTWQDMNGATARVTRAADMAAERGILVVNGAGNEGDSPYHNTLVAPADGRSVLAVGAVTMAGTRAAFSSVGPTTDRPPRIKPDVMAPGVAVVCAGVENDSSYVRLSGTSLACPLAAGVAALLLSVHPATPAQLADILRSTATRDGLPDDSMGWGVLDAESAWRQLIALFPTAAGDASPAFAAPRFANPFHPSGRIEYDSGTASFVTLRIYDAFGRRVRDLVRAPPSAHPRVVAWDGTDDSGRPLARGVYLVELRTGSPPARSTAKLTLVR